MNGIPLDELIPVGSRLACHDSDIPDGDSEWDFGDAILQGGTGRVYELFETHPPFRRAVIKMLRPDKTDDEHVTDFKREGQRLKERIAGDGAPRCYGIGTHGGVHYIIMQRGDPLRRNLDVADTVVFVDDLAECLSTLHANGYCHGDVKPHNLCLLNGRPSLLDLGAVRKLIPDGTAESIARTPGYSPPELAEGACAAPWIDVFGMAVTLNEILSDEALDVFSPAIRAGMDPRPEARLQTPAALCAAVHKCYDDHRRQKKRAIVTRVITHTLVAGVAVGVTVIVSANRKEHHSDKAVKCLQCETATMMELNLGKLALQASNAVDAVESFRRAKAYGETAARILRLIEKTNK